MPLDFLSSSRAVFPVLLLPDVQLLHLGEDGVRVVHVLNVIALERGQELFHKVGGGWIASKGRLIE